MKNEFSFIGSIGNVFGHHLNGWAFDQNNPQIKTTLEVFVNDDSVEYIVANNFRKDKKESNHHPDGFCGFKFNISEYCQKPKVYEIKIKFANSDIYLHNSPFIFDNRKYKKRVLILGLNKSGTSILAYRIASGLKTKKIFFEPQGRANLDDYKEHIKYTNHNKVVTKTLFHYNQNKQIREISSLYNKKILIIRDPRDIIVSSFFYNWFKGHNPSPEKFKIAYERTKIKEMNPEEISFTELTKGFVNIQRVLETKFQSFMNEIKELDKSWFIIKCEDFIDHKIQPLNDYLGFKVNMETEVHKRVKRVKRSNKKDNWRVWFTESEIEGMRNLFNPYLEQLGYSTEDWALTRLEKLDPKTGSEYMFSLFHS